MKTLHLVSFITSILAAGAATGCSSDDSKLPQSCQDIVDADSSASDDDYTLYLDGDVDKPWVAYCKDMKRTPAEYLTLQRTNADYNFSELSVRRLNSTNTAEDVTVKTSYSKLRIDPLTLAIDTSDQTFANSNSPGGEPVRIGPSTDQTDVSAMPFGVAASCFQLATGTEPPAGHANVDLSGTPFVIDQHWCNGGQNAKQTTPTMSSDDSAAGISGGTTAAITGSCAWTQPLADSCDGEPFNGASGLLQLDYVRTR